MEAFRSLISGDLPPVGNPICLTGTEPTPQLDGYTATWVDSGTAALALALLDAKQQRPTLTAPEVIIPAYCCPDLVAAAEFAGIIPVVLDIGTDDTAFDANTLAAAINSSTLAVIAMTFLGIREDWPNLASVLSKHPEVKIIEDNAQWFPDLQGEDTFCADYLVFSFGRGKPLSLLGGGALFSRAPLSQAALNTMQPSSPAGGLKIKYALYNTLLQPNFYWFLNHNPWLQLGQTHFCPLAEIAGLDADRAALLGANFAVYRRRARHLEAQYGQIIAAAGLFNHPALASSRQRRLLRFPFFCSDKAQRDELLAVLNHHGLGASPMYQQALREIPGVKAKVREFNPPEKAADFAQRLITLPLHQGVTAQHLNKVAKILSRV